MDVDQNLAPIELEVEQTFAVRGRGVFVMARVVDSRREFTLSERPTIGGVRIERWLGVPRKLSADGRPRTDCVVFRLIDDNDRSKLETGQRVLLA